MDFSPTEAQRAIADLAAQIVGDLGGDDAPERTAQTWRALADAGLLGLALPEDLGGGGEGFLAAHLVLYEIGRAAATLPYWETVVLGALPIVAFGTQAQQQRWLPPVLAGEMTLTTALGDGGGSGTAQPTTARRDAGGWVLDGIKTSVPAGLDAAAILVPAATDLGHTGLWIVPSDTAGLVVRPQGVISDAPFAHVALEGVTVGDDALLGTPDGVPARWLFDHAFAGIASLTAGLCAEAVRLAADYTSTREQFGRPVATFQAVAQRVADAYIDAQAVELTALQAAWRLSAGLPAGDEVAIATWWAAEAGHRVIHAALHVHGGVGVDRSYPLHRYFTAIKQLEFLGGAAPAHLLRLGASLAAEPV